MCFDEDTPSGTYEASIILDDGTVIKNKLVISENVSYEPPTLVEDNTSILWAVGIAGVVLLGTVICLRRRRETRIRVE